MAAAGAAAAGAAAGADELRGGAAGGTTGREGDESSVTLRCRAETLESSVTLRCRAENLLMGERDIGDGELGEPSPRLSIETVEGAMHMRGGMASDSESTDSI